MNEKLLILPVLIPVLSGLFIGLCRPDRQRARNTMIFLAVLINSLLIMTLLLYPPGGTLVLFRLAGKAFFSLKIDGAGKIFLSLSAFLWVPATLYSFEYMDHEENQPRFYCFYLMCYGVTAGAALSANLISMFVFYVLLTLFAIPLIAHHKADSRSKTAVQKFIIYSAAGTILSLTGILIVSSQAGLTDFMPGGIGSSAEGNALLLTAYMLTFIGFGVNAAIFPLHAWLPAACVAPAPADALLDAVAVMNCGAFACLRCTYYVFGTSMLAGTWAQNAALAITAFTILFGSAMALREQQLERRLAYSTISNMNYVLFGIALMTTQGLLAGFSHMIFHGVIKLMLFSCAGTILCKTGREYVQEMTGLGRRMPKTFMALFLGALALTGTPPLPGFFSKVNLLVAAAEADAFLARAGIAALLLSALLTAAYLLPLSVRAFLVSEQDECVFTERDRDPGLPMLISFAVLSLAILLLSISAAPVTVLLKHAIGGL